MKYWILDIWAAKGISQNNFNQYIAKLEKDEYDAIILFCQYEFSLDIRGYDLIVDIARKKNIKIYSFIGCDFDPNDITFLKKIANDGEVKFYSKATDDMEINSWQTIFFRQSLHQLIAVTDSQHNTFIENLDDLNYKYHFIYLNNKAHKHRCLLIDNIAKFDLLKYSAYSWHNDGYARNFEFTYYDGKQKTLDEQFENKNKRNQCCVPAEYYQSFFQLVSETCNHKMSITEKTVTALVLGKPFIVFGKKGIHRLLKDLGFELYDELFDYSFDSLEFNREKYDLVCENIKKITSLSLDDCRQFHTRIQDKVLYNRKRAIEIAYDQNYVPELAKYVLEHYSDAPYIKTMINEEKSLQDIKKLLTEKF